MAWHGYFVSFKLIEMFFIIIIIIIISITIIIIIITIKHVRKLKLE